jgi:pyruvate,orthophosphate dikinase
MHYYDSDLDIIPYSMVGNPEDPKVSGKLLGKGLAASGGAVSGQIVFTCDEAESFRAEGLSCILCKDFTSADDIAGMHVGLILYSQYLKIYQFYCNLLTFTLLSKAADGVLTSRGGLTSHASVVMRGMGKTAVVGAQDIIVDHKAQQLRTKDGKMQIQRGDVITIDGSTGIVYQGELPTITPIHDEEFQTILHWADKYKRMQVLANADTAEDVKKAIEMGAEGVGLCRTEHMFFAPDRIQLFRQLILTENESDRKSCLQQILDMQQGDFVEIFRAAENHEVVIRLLDSPTHEFLPNPDKPDYDRVIEELAVKMGWSDHNCRTRIKSLRESNPMMGCRGCRQSIVHPDLVEMQTRAIIGIL